MPETVIEKKRCADFLVIGAMKCGTTTLYYDLRTQPSIFLPDKESNFLLKTDPTDGFETAGPEQVCGEVCPDYAKLPEHSNIAEKSTGFATKIIYLVRNPVERLMSHHHFISSLHAPQNPGMSREIDEAIANFPELIDYGRYAFQLKPWIKKLGRDSILVMRFEDFIANRQDSLAMICRFIGAEFDPDLIDPDSIHNRSEARPVLTSFWKRVRENPFYRAVLRPFTSLETRNRIRRWILPSSTGRPAPPSPEMLKHLTNIYRADLEELQTLLSYEKPLWNLD